MENYLLRNSFTQQIFRKIQQIQYSVAGTLLGAGNIAVNKSDPALKKLAF